MGNRRRGVPLALAMLHVSNPTIGAMDALSRLSHDQDHEVAHNAIISLGPPPITILTQMSSRTWR